MSENCSHDCSSCGESCGERTAPQHEPQNDQSNVKKVIAVMSGKGGVGKSLVTSLLASQGKKAGYKTAILDADVTGPSIPKAFGITERPQGTDEVIYPVMSASGIPVMSLNLLLENETDPVVWRGPIISGTIRQFWSDVVWGDVDCMLVDMPPGTGDVALTVLQSLPVDGIVIVTSPQELVGMIVEKAVKMAQMMGVPVIALVENMSYFTCPDCGAVHHIFGESHIEDAAAKHAIATTCQIPMDPAIATAMDEGAIESIDTDVVDPIVSLMGVTETMPQTMRIAVAYENGQVFQHFGHSEQFKVYEIEDGMVTRSEVIDTNGSGHGALAGLLAEKHIDALICGGIGGGAQQALAQAGVSLLAGVTGDADEAVESFLAGTLAFGSDANCSHHDEQHDGSCADHGCGEHGCCQ